MARSASGHDLDAVLDDLVTQAEALLGADHASVNLVGWDGPIAREAIATRRPVVATNLPSGSTIAVPLYVGDTFVGMLDVNYRDPQAAGVADLRVAVALAAHAAVAIHTAHLAEESTLRLRRLEAAQRVSAAVSRAGDLGTVLDVVLAATDELADAPHSMIALLDPDGRYVRGVRGRGLPEGLLEATVRRIYSEPDPDEDILAIVVRTRVQQWFAPDHPARHQSTAQRFHEGGVQQGTVVTPIAEHDELFGVLVARVSTTREDDAEMLATLRLIAEQAAGAIARERMRENALAAMRTQALLAAVVTSADDAILSTDLEGRILSWNQAAEHLYGYSADEVIGRPIGFVYPPERKPESFAISRAIADGEALTFPDTERVRKDGTIVPVSVTISPVRDPDGQVLGAAAFVRDITEAKRAARAREEFGRLERLRSLGQLAGGVVHDVNHALSLVVTHADLASMETDPERVQAALEMVMQAAMGIGETMRGLLRFVREIPEESRRDVEIEPLMREVVALTAPRWRDEAQAEGRRIDVVVDVDRSILVHAWIDQLRNALVNLVLNAVDALPAGGTIVLTAVTRASETVVEVRDDGVGMPPDVQAHLFDPFFTTKGTRGTGLGLTMVRTAIERHDGQVEVESAQGRGTTVRLRLPVAVPGQRSDGPADGATTAGIRTLRVLVVEDEPQLAAASATLLTAQGHNPTVVHNGEEAIAALATASFDAVVCDLGLGTGLSGWDVARAVRECSPSTRFVLATGWAAAVDPETVQAAGVHALLDKPYDQAALARALAPD